MSIIFDSDVQTPYCCVYVYDPLWQSELDRLDEDAFRSDLLGVAPHALKIFCLQNGVLPLRVHSVDQIPERFDTVEWQIVNEASLTVDSNLVIGNPIADQQFPLPLRAGIYRVRALFKDLSLPKKIDDNIKCEIYFQPDNATRPRVQRWKAVGLQF